MQDPKKKKKKKTTEKKTRLPPNKPTGVVAISGPPAQDVTRSPGIGEYVLPTAVPFAELADGKSAMVPTGATPHARRTPSQAAKADRVKNIKKGSMKNSLAKCGGEAAR
jgi:hypothetical protein